MTDLIMYLVPDGVSYYGSTSRYPSSFRYSDGGCILPTKAIESSERAPDKYCIEYFLKSTSTAGRSV
jgi:hypothetical protein